LALGAAKDVAALSGRKGRCRRARLETMVRTSNGFEIAETDLSSAARRIFRHPPVRRHRLPHRQPVRDKNSSNSPAAKPSLAADSQQDTMQRLLRQLPPNGSAATTSRIG